jgi:hypothetical protein
MYVLLEFTMRKLLLSLVCTLLIAGLVVAAEYTVTAYKDKVVTFKDKDDKEVTGKITDDTKIYRYKGDEKIEAKLDALEKTLGNEKLMGKLKVEATIKDGVITEITTKGGKKKN